MTATKQRTKKTENSKTALTALGHLRDIDLRRHYYSYIGTEKKTKEQKTKKTKNLKPKVQGHKLVNACLITLFAVQRN